MLVKAKLGCFAFSAGSTVSIEPDDDGDHAVVLGVLVNGLIKPLQAPIRYPMDALEKI